MKLLMTFYRTNKAYLNVKNKAQQLTQYIFQVGVRWYANCAPRLRGSFRCSVSFGQERPPDRTGRLSEIRTDNMYQPCGILKKPQTIPTAQMT